MIAFNRQWILALPPRTGSTALVTDLREEGGPHAVDGFHHTPLSRYLSSFNAWPEGFTGVVLYRDPAERLASAWFHSVTQHENVQQGMGVFRVDRQDWKIFRDWARQTLVNTLVQRDRYKWPQDMIATGKGPHYRRHVLTWSLPCAWWAGGLRHVPGIMTSLDGLKLFHPDMVQRTGLGARGGTSNRTKNHAPPLFDAVTLLRDEFGKRLERIYADDFKVLANCAKQG